MGMDNNVLQEVLKQVGPEALKKSMGDIGIGYCDVHGSYAYDMTQTGGIAGLCPLCPHIEGDNGNGTSATKVEHYINTNPVQSLKNPQQLMNPHGH